MARPYSLDLRERVVGRVAAGRTVREVAAALCVPRRARLVVGAGRYGASNTLDDG